MRKMAVWAALIAACGTIGLAQGGAQTPAGGGGRGPGAEGRTVILEQAPKDHSIAIPKDKLAQYLKDMDAKKLQTLRMIEGGKYNVNIRRITAAETGLVHPITADLWVVLEGGGTLTTGGVLEKGKILGGQSRPIKVGDVVYIPSGLPHGVSGVDKNITWLNVRWDTDWPADAPMGAGTLNGLLGRAGGPRGAREGSVEARAARAGAAGAAGPAAPPAARGPALPPGSQQTLPYSYGGSGELFFPKEQLDQIMAGMRLNGSDTHGPRLIDVVAVASAARATNASFSPWNRWSACPKYWKPSSSANFAVATTLLSGSTGAMPMPNVTIRPRSRFGWPPRRGRCPVVLRCARRGSALSLR